jgi:uncharacterized membrane protein
MENLGMVLLVGFYVTCLVGFVSVLTYGIVTMVHSYIMEKIEKIRSNYIR